MKNVTNIILAKERAKAQNAGRSPHPPDELLLVFANHAPASGPAMKPIENASPMRAYKEYTVLYEKRQLIFAIMKQNETLKRFSSKYRFASRSSNYGKFCTTFEAISTVFTPLAIKVAMRFLQRKKYREGTYMTQTSAWKVQLPFYQAKYPA